MNIMTKVFWFTLYINMLECSKNFATKQQDSKTRKKYHPLKREKRLRTI